MISKREKACVVVVAVVVCPMVKRKEERKEEGKNREEEKRKKNRREGKGTTEIKNMRKKEEKVRSVSPLFQCPRGRDEDDTKGHPP